MEQWHLVLAAVFVFLSLVTLQCSESFANPVASSMGAVVRVAANPVASLSKAQRNKLDNDILKHANMVTKYAQDRCKEIEAISERADKQFPPQVRDYVGIKLKKLMHATPQRFHAMKFMIAASTPCLERSAPPGGYSSPSIGNQ